MIEIVAIDPGTTHTGLVYMDERRVIDVKTISFPKSVGIDNKLLDDRCKNIWRQAEQFLMMHGHKQVVIEGYRPYPGMRIARSTSHQTPWLVGYLLRGIEGNGEEPIIQTSHQVLNPRTEGNVAIYKDYLVHGRYQVYEGQKLLTNDHLRTAFLHGFYYLIHEGYVNA